MQKKALIFNDDPDAIHELTNLLGKKHGFEVASCTDAKHVEARLNEKFDLIIGDLSFGGPAEQTMRLLEKLREKHPYAHMGVYTSSIIFRDERKIFSGFGVEVINRLTGKTQLIELIERAKLGPHKEIKVTAEKRELGLLWHPATPTEKRFLALNPEATPEEQMAILELLRTTYDMDLSEKKRKMLKSYLDAYVRHFKGKVERHEKPKLMPKRKPI